MLTRKRLRKELVILARLRKNSRSSLREMAEDADMSVSSALRFLRRLERRLVERHVSLLSFRSIGFPVRSAAIVSVDDKEFFIENFLSASHVAPFINNVCILSTLGTAAGRISGLSSQQDEKKRALLFIETVFPSLASCWKFLDLLSSRSVIHSDFFIVDAIKEEEIGLAY